MSREGEPPKIFHFSEFDIDRVRGDYDVDYNGSPKLTRTAAPNQYKDRRGNLVNQHGYLIDHDNNIIDENGDRVFSKHALTEDGNIPKVYRDGLPKDNSDSSLSDMMREIEDEHDFGG